MLAESAPFTLRMAAALSMILPSVVPAAAQDRAVVVLRWSQAECLSRHAEDYINLPGDPTLLFAGYCERSNFSPTPEQIAADTSSNAFEIGVIDIKISTGDATVPKNAKATMLVLTEAQIACLRDNFDTVVTHVPRQAGQAETFAEIDFGKCGE